MKRYMHGMSVLALLVASIASHDLHAFRRNPLRLICAGIGWVTQQAFNNGAAQAIESHLRDVHPRDHYTADKDVRRIISLASGVVVGGLAYYIGDPRYTSESYLESAHEAVEIIIQENAIARKIPKDAESCLAVLQGMYKGDLWFFQAIHKLQPLQDQLVKIIDDVEQVRKATANDIAFVAQCQIVSARASQALHAIGTALMYARSELTRQSEKLHTIGETNA